MENIRWKFVCTFIYDYGSGMWPTFPRKLEPTLLFFKIWFSVKIPFYFVIPFALQIKGVLESRILFLCYHVSTISKLAGFSTIFICICFCLWSSCVCTCMYMGVCVCVFVFVLVSLHMWGQKLNPEPIDWASLASWPVLEITLSVLKLELLVGCHACGYWESELWSSCLHGNLCCRHFTHRAISPSQ